MAASRKGTLFHQAVSSVFKEWQALRIAVDNMFGGPMSKEKALWLEEVTADFVSNNADVQKWELEDYLSTLMDQEFCTQVDDASLPEISKKICELYSYCVAGNTDKVEEFIKSSKPAQVMDVQCVSQESIDGDKDEEVSDGCLDDIIEEESEMEAEEEDKMVDSTTEGGVSHDEGDEDIRQRLDQVTISEDTAISTTDSTSITTTSSSTSNSSTSDQPQIDKRSDEGDWEVVKKGRRKSRSKRN